MRIIVCNPSEGLYVIKASALHVIKPPVKYAARALITYQSAKGSLIYNKTNNITDLPNAIARIISQSLEQGIPEDEICVVAPQWNQLHSISNALKQLLPNVSFDAPDISPFKYDPMNPFYLLARLVFTDSGKHIKLRKRLANDFLEILTNEYKISILVNYDYHFLLKTINSLTLSVDGKDGMAVYFKVVNRVLSSLGVYLKNEVILNKTFELYMEKARERIKRYSISQTYKKHFVCFVHYNNIDSNLPVLICSSPTKYY